MSILRMTDLDLAGKRVLIREGEPGRRGLPYRQAGPDDPKTVCSARDGTAVLFPRTIPNERTR